MPDDSFVLKYLQFLGSFLSVGPPVYFVLNNTGKVRILIHIYSISQIYSKEYSCYRLDSNEHLHISFSR